MRLKQKLIFMNKLRHFVDFCICIYYFPNAINLVYFLKIQGLHTIAEKFFLYLMSREIPVEGDILEIGSFMGGSSIVLALGNEASRKKGKVWLIEPYPRPNKERFLNLFKDYNLGKYVELVEKTSNDARTVVDSQFRFIFVDAVHQYEAIKKDISLWQGLLKEGGVIAFHGSKEEGVVMAIKELIERSDKFTVLGNISSTLYICKGNFGDKDLISQLKRLNDTREICKSIANKIKF